jgi:hypothetical protein
VELCLLLLCHYLILDNIFMMFLENFDCANHLSSLEVLVVAGLNLFLHLSDGLVHVLLGACWLQQRPSLMRLNHLLLLHFLQVAE